MGLIFPKVYNLIPGKGAIKGLFYGLIAFLFTEVIILPYSLVYGFYWESRVPLLSEAIFFGVKQLIFLGLSVWIVFGIVLGYLYKPPK
jgi:hypothetical protein